MKGRERHLRVVLDDQHTATQIALEQIAERVPGAVTKQGRTVHVIYDWTCPEAIDLFHAMHSVINRGRGAMHLNDMEDRLMMPGLVDAYLDWEVEQRGRTS